MPESKGKEQKKKPAEETVSRARGGSHDRKKKSEGVSQADLKQAEALMAALGITDQAQKDDFMKDFVTAQGGDPASLITKEPSKELKS